MRSIAVLALALLTGCTTNNTTIIEEQNPEASTDGTASDAPSDGSTGDVAHETGDGGSQDAGPQDDASPPAWCLSTPGMAFTYLAPDAGGQTVIDEIGDGGHLCSPEPACQLRCPPGTTSTACLDQCAGDVVLFHAYGDLSPIASLLPPSDGGTVPQYVPVWDCCF